MTDPLIAAARFLAAQLPWLRHATDEQGAPYAADVFREIGDCVARMRSLVDGPREQMFLGVCGATVTWDEDLNETPRDQPCAGYVFGNTKLGICRACKARWDDVDQRLDGLRDEVRARAYRATQIEEAYGISAKTILSWRDRGQLVPHGTDGYDQRGTPRPTFNVGDVLDLAAQSAARREERRVERARKIEQRSGGAA